MLYEISIDVHENYIDTECHVDRRKLPHLPRLGEIIYVDYVEWNYPTRDFIVREVAYDEKQVLYHVSLKPCFFWFRVFVYWHTLVFHRSRNTIRKLVMTKSLIMRYIELPKL